MLRIKKILLWFKFFFLIWRTPGWARRTFSRICNLDYMDWENLHIGVLKACCSTVWFKPNRGPEDFGELFIEEYAPGKIVVRLFTKGISISFEDTPYRDGEYLKDTRWAKTLKRLNRHLKDFDIYHKRELEQMEEMQQGPIFGM